VDYDRMASIAKYKTVKHIGKCIYCGSTENLHDEHCIPESLNGTHVLGKGSCGDCGTITSRFEGSYARDSMLPVRTAWNMKSKRSKKKRPTEFPMKFIKNGVEKIINVPVEDHWSIIPMVELGPPGKYPLMPHAKGLQHGQYRIEGFQIRSEEHIEYLKEKYDADAIGVTCQINVENFLRMIAKIAYCLVVWRYGLNNIGKAYVVPAILGKSKDIMQWVGSDGTQRVYEETKSIDVDHSGTNWFTNPDGEIWSQVKLFKKSFTPEYKVIVGELTPQALGFYHSIGRR
jgi:hypothetical protein